MSKMQEGGFVMKEEKLTWKEIVRTTLLELGGQGHLSEINKIVKGHPKTNNNSP